MGYGNTSKHGAPTQDEGRLQSEGEKILVHLSTAKRKYDKKM